MQSFSDMDINDFSDLSLDQLSKATGLDKTRWSKYFGGSLMTESVLNHCAAKLVMQPHDLLFAINKKRLHRNATSAKVNLVA